MLMRMPIYMALVCFTLIMSSLSVIIQRIYFKVTHGKRIFKMSPIHHHFELCGMTEKQIVAMYAGVIGGAVRHYPVVCLTYYAPDSWR